MTTIRIVIVAAALALALGACSRDEESAAGAGNALLDYVPADTPYLAANLEPLPEDVVDAWLLRAQPVLDEMQTQLSKARTDLEGQDPAGVDDPGERLALALLRELDGKLSREGLNSLGLDIRSHKVVYGLGAFPVLRVGLSNAVSMQATIHRVLDGAGLTAPEQSLQGVAYWRVGPDAHHDMPVGLYLAILEDHLAIGILPAAAEAETLPAFLGLERPAQSDARTRLAELNRAHGYTAHGSAILDLRLLADQFLQADSLTARVLAGAGAYDPATITPECVAEVHGIIDNSDGETARITLMAGGKKTVRQRPAFPLEDFLKIVFESMQSLERRLELVFRRHPLSAAAGAAYVCLMQLDLQRLRGLLAVRSLRDGPVAAP